MKIRYAFAFAVASAFFVSGCDRSDSVKAESPLPVYLLLGQSNMVGMRSVAEELPEDLKKPNENAIIFKDGKWVQVSPSSFEVKGFGPEVSFAHEVAKKEKIGIIKVSAGDTKLAKEWNSEPKGFLYQKTLAEISAAEKTRKISIKGVMWMQGESDGGNANYAEAYKSNLEKFISNIKKEAGNQNLKFSVCRVTSPESMFKYTPVVRHAQENVKAEGYKWFDCDGLSKGPDNLHYDTKGIVKLGWLFSQSIN
ncbi:hypothetical protein HUC42_02745 [Escherichia coli]|uniref:sialate O-acetylesterase n=1 Tax=Escherichia coli TaxID=562 RepID=UPI00157C480E|nr:sialate O-acetylesterase [Escherichia coli]NUD78851.1 hypothetical protein [Escherichia coli]